MKRKIKRSLLGGIISVIIIIVALFGGQVFTSTRNTVSSKIEENKIDIEQFDGLKVYFIDVGQGDSIFIQSDEKTMLIDAGTNEAGPKIVNFLQEKGIEKIDYLIGTHPHEDHIGGLDDIILSFSIGTFYMPKVQTNTKTFEDVLDAAMEKGIAITSPKIEDTYQVGKANCKFLSSKIDKSNLNLSSLVIHMTYEGQSFLFMGDAEKENEQAKFWPQVDVLKIGHHGSKTSSSKAFLDQTNPQIAIISLGKDNIYHHPSQEVIERLEQINTQIYRTDVSGTILLLCDGKNILIEKEKES